MPVRAFYEGYATEKVLRERTGKPIRRHYRFHLPGPRAFLLAVVQQDGRFSVVITEPNASVTAIHDRTSLLLIHGEPNVWLASDFGILADRQGVNLVVNPERKRKKVRQTSNREKATWSTGAAGYPSCQLFTISQNPFMSINQSCGYGLPIG